MQSQIVTSVAISFAFVNSNKCHVLSDVILKNILMFSFSDSITIQHVAFADVKLLIILY